MSVKSLDRCAQLLSEIMEQGGSHVSKKNGITSGRLMSSNSKRSKSADKSKGKKEITPRRREASKCSKPPFSVPTGKKSQSFGEKKVLRKTSGKENKVRERSGKPETWFRRPCQEPGLPLAFHDSVSTESTVPGSPHPMNATDEVKQHHPQPESNLKLGPKKLTHTSIMTVPFNDRLVCSTPDRSELDLKPVRDKPELSQEESAAFSMYSTASDPAQYQENGQHPLWSATQGLAKSGCQSSAPSLRDMTAALYQPQTTTTTTAMYQPPSTTVTPAMYRPPATTVHSYLPSQSEELSTASYRNMGNSAPQNNSKPFETNETASRYSLMSSGYSSHLLTEGTKGAAYVPNHQFDPKMNSYRGGAYQPMSPFVAKFNGQSAAPPLFSQSLPSSGQYVVQVAPANPPSQMHHPSQFAMAPYLESQGSFDRRVHFSSDTKPASVTPESTPRSEDLAERVMPSNVAERVLPPNVAERVLPPNVAERFLPPTNVAQRIPPSNPAFSHEPVLAEREESGSQTVTTGGATGVTVETQTSLAEENYISIPTGAEDTDTTVNTESPQNLEPEEDLSQEPGEEESQSSEPKVKPTVTKKPNKVSTKAKAKANPKKKDTKPKKKRESTVELIRKLKYLLQELVVASQTAGDLEVARLTGEVKDTFGSFLPGLATFDWQMEIDLALQPMRSENAQLRRKLRILSQQMKDKDIALENATKPDPCHEIIHLHMLNQSLQKQLSEERTIREQLQQQVRLLDEDLHKTSSEKMEMLQLLSNKDTDHLKSDQNRVLELRTMKGELLQLDEERQGLETHIKDLQHEIQMSNFTLGEKEVEIGRLKKLVKDLQASMNKLLQDLEQSSNPSVQGEWAYESTRSNLKRISNMIEKEAPRRGGDERREAVTEPKSMKHADISRDSSARRSLQFGGSPYHGEEAHNVEREVSTARVSARFASHLQQEKLRQARQEALSDVTDYCLQDGMSPIKDWSHDSSTAPPGGNTVRDILAQIAQKMTQMGTQHEHEESLDNKYLDHAEGSDSSKTDSSSIDEQLNVNNNAVSDHDTTLKTDAELTQYTIEHSRYSITDYFTRYKQAANSNSTTPMKPNVSHDKSANEMKPEQTGSSREESALTLTDQSQSTTSSVGQWLTELEKIKDKSVSKSEGFAGDTQHSSQPSTQENLIFRSFHSSEKDLSELSNTCKTTPRETNEEPQTFKLLSADCASSQSDDSIHFQPINEGGAADDARQETVYKGTVLDTSLSTIQDLGSHPQEHNSTSASSVDDDAFRAGLANLDANIARIQESLKVGNKKMGATV